MSRSLSKSNSPRKPTHKDRSPQRQSPRPSPQNQQNLVFEPKLYVSGLPPLIKKEQIEGTFAKYGAISDCFIVNKEDFSFAFVLYQERKDAQEALNDLNSNGAKIKDSRIRCQWAKPRSLKVNSDNKGHGNNENHRNGARGGRQCYKCGKDGHFARECTNQASEDRKGQTDTKRAPRSSSKHDHRSRRHQEESQKRRGKKRDRSSSSSSSEPPRKSSKKRQQHREEAIRRKSSNLKRAKQSSSSIEKSSSSSEDNRRGKKNVRSRSKELRKGKKRVSSSSSSSSSSS